MNFDWLNFCRKSDIPFVTEGPNTAKNHINVHCPFCGRDDPSEHMGLSLDTREPYWGCWRDATHRGKAPMRLIVALLNCSYNEAFEIFKENSQQLSVDDYDAVLDAFLNQDKTTQVIERRRHPLELPREFKPLSRPTAYGKPFYEYLHERGFDDVPELARRYNLRYCLTGRYKNRIIFPIYRRGLLVSWTARDITGKSAVRYDTLTDRQDASGYGPALSDLSDTLFNGDRARRVGHAKTLVVCEGPFDALKVDWIGRHHRVRAVATFGMPKRAQIIELIRTSEKGYRRVLVALDRDARISAERLQDELCDARGDHRVIDTMADMVSTEVRRLDLPPGFKDPGELNERALVQLLRSTMH